MKGRDLSILDWKKPSAENPPDSMVAYEAQDKKGRGYYLVRNNHNPDMMFVVSDGFSVTPGWYSDKSGVIKRVA